MLDPCCYVYIGPMLLRVYWTHAVTCILDRCCYVYIGPMLLRVYCTHAFTCILYPCCYVYIGPMLLRVYWTDAVTCILTPEMIVAKYIWITTRLNTLDEYLVGVMHQNKK